MKQSLSNNPSSPYAIIDPSAFAVGAGSANFIAMMGGGIIALIFRVICGFLFGAILGGITAWVYNRIIQRKACSILFVSAENSNINAKKRPKIQRWADQKFVNLLGEGPRQQ